MYAQKALQNWYNTTSLRMTWDETVQKGSPTQTKKLGHVKCVQNSSELTLIGSWLESWLESGLEV